MVAINKKVVLWTLLAFFATRYFITENWYCLTSGNKKGPT